MDDHVDDRPTTSPAPRRRGRARKALAASAVAALAVGAVATGVIVRAPRQTPADAAAAHAAGVASAQGSTSAAARVAGRDQASPDWEELYQEWYQAWLAQGQQGVTAVPGDAQTWTGVASTQAEATAASDAEATGLVMIDTVLGYEAAEAAGTGMVLTSDGLILTNNHVVEGATDITVTVGSTGETYTANLVGTDATEDVALLQLDDASGLSTVTIDDDDASVGEVVTAVGNAEGGGVLMAADGAITDLDASVTTSSEYAVAGETLDSMIEFEADVVGGDSGGALLDDEGEVVGMTTAASSGLATTIAYAVPIDEALAIAAQIQAGDESGTVTIGYPAMLGVAIGATAQYGQTATGGATVLGVYADTPAAAIGLERGATITALDGADITGADDLTAALTTREPGDSVDVSWTDAAGQQHSATATLTQGPIA
ncbi:S1C family serine protease [Demequina sp. NBRC 110055]|uniref:S1C family serine protease n=1 Tax=Demequina sp. NBRC 110055 TaxID=1570344 RepID=UPI000A066DC8|nr:trypsin-like peptidase domain-containing protein [Demequina sp. NBRC 110055]